MCPWLRSHAPLCGRQPWLLPSRIEYLSSEGVLLPRVYGLPPDACGSSCGAPLLGRRPPPGLCASTPVISCFNGSG